MFLGQPPFLCGFQVKAWCVIQVLGFRRVCPIHPSIFGGFHLLLVVAWSISRVLCCWWSQSHQWLENWYSSSYPCLRLAFQGQSRARIGWSGVILLWPGEIASSAWHSRVRDSTGWPSVSLLQPGDIAVLTCKLVSACKSDWAERLRNTLCMLLGP